MKRRRMVAPAFVYNLLFTVTNIVKLRLSLDHNKACSREIYPLGLGRKGVGPRQDTRGLLAPKIRPRA